MTPITAASYLSTVPPPPSSRTGRKTGRLILVHTAVPSELRGQGLAERPCELPSPGARVEDLTVVLWCPYCASGYVTVPTSRTPSRSIGPHRPRGWRWILMFARPHRQASGGRRLRAVPCRPPVIVAWGCSPGATRLVKVTDLRLAIRPPHQSRVLNSVSWPGSIRQPPAASASGLDYLVGRARFGSAASYCSVANPLSERPFGCSASQHW
jgi:hypothetical protein